MKEKISLARLAGCFRLAVTHTDTDAGGVNCSGRMPMCNHGFAVCCDDLGAGPASSNPRTVIDPLPGISAVRRNSRPGTL
jgi:hypothetical protein